MFHEPVRAMWKALTSPFSRGHKNGFTRRHIRHDCVVVGTMTVLEIGAEFDGVLIELSQGGCAFRTASMYVLDRTGQEVSIRTEYFEGEGRIRISRPENYGIQFFHEVDEEAINRIVAEHGGKIAELYLTKRN